MRYLVNCGIDFEVDGSPRRYEPGDLASAIPEASVGWLLEQGTITEKIELEVAPDADEWKLSGLDDVARFDSQAAAIDAAVAAAKAHGFAEITIKGRDGRIRDKRTFPRSADPEKSKG